MRIKHTYVVIVILIALSGILAYDALTSYISPYLTTSQVLTSNERYLKKRIQIIGVVVNGSTQIMEDGGMTFNLTDGKTVISVSYRGGPPQNFMDGGQVVVIGELADSLTMAASQILVKCPSKYESEGTSILTEPIFLAALLLGAAAIIYFAISTSFKHGHK